jgi:hypothetical protein
MPAVEVHVAVLDRDPLGSSHSLVVENVPVSPLLDMCHIVATGGVGADVAHNGHKLIFAWAIQHFLRAIPKTCGAASDHGSNS